MSSLVDKGKAVSIHAPVRVRQIAEWDFALLEEVSIHAPVRVRHDLAKGAVESLEFQFTHP